MSRYVFVIPVDASWSATDRLVLYRGTENAADLAGSTPAGGVKVAERTIGGAAAGSQIRIEMDHNPQNICATLPVGVSCIDQAGNESAKAEYLISIEDPPRPPGRPDVAATANPGEATLSWDASPDL